MIDAILLALAFLIPVSLGLGFFYIILKDDATSNYPTCDYWDFTLNALMDDGHELREVGRYTAKLGP